MNEIKGYSRLSGAPVIPKGYKPYVEGSSDNVVPDNNWYEWRRPKKHYATEIFTPKIPDMTEEYNQWVEGVKMNRMMEAKRAEIHQYLQKNRKDVLIDTLTKGIKSLEDDKFNEQLLASGILDPQIANSLKQDRAMKLAQMAVEKGIPVDVTRAYKVNKAIVDSLPIDLKSVGSPSDLPDVPASAMSSGAMGGARETSPLRHAVEELLAKTLPKSYGEIAKPLTASEFLDSEFIRNRRDITEQRENTKELIELARNRLDDASSADEAAQYNEMIEQLTDRLGKLEKRIKNYPATYESLEKRSPRKRRI